MRQVEPGVLLVQQAQDDAFPGPARQRRDADVDQLPAEAEPDAAVLRHASLGDVEAGHYLDTAHQDRRDVRRHPQLLLKDAVAAHPHDQGLLVGFDMDVGNALAQALGDQARDATLGGCQLPGRPAGGDSLATLRRMLADRRAGAPSIRSLRPDVPPSLDALIAKCLDPDPGRRHRGAGELAEDLGRFLEDLPMKHGPEPSLAERACKWARRHPSICSSSSVAFTF